MQHPQLCSRAYSYMLHGHQIDICQGLALSAVRQISTLHTEQAIVDCEIGSAPFWRQPSRLDSKAISNLGRGAETCAQGLECVT